MSSYDATNRSTVRTQMAPAAIGPYSQGILVGNTLYCSGQIAIDPKSGSMVTDSVEVETERVLDNLGAILQAASMDFDHVVRCTVYLADINDYAQVNEVYSRYFNEMLPAREAVQVAALPRGARVEISCIAVR
ncbi:MAG: RidA family protein [Bacteroidetes bacterium]|jgi:2-iminobutanoate/2-iminopropanoate deaminase|nr:RidA family protein [Bacteroidota bacterium]